MSAMVVCLGLMGCGGGSPTNPSPAVPTYPSVAGNYAGSMTFTFSTLGGSLICPVSTSVTQTGASVTIGALTPSGTCANLGPSPGLGTFTMTTTGSLGTTTLNGLPNAACTGGYNATFTGAFSGSTFQFSFAYTATSGDCLTQPGNFTLSGTLTKQ